MSDKVRCKFCNDEFVPDTTAYCVLFFKFFNCDEDKNKIYSYICPDCANAAIAAVEESIHHE